MEYCPVVIDVVYAYNYGMRRFKIFTTIFVLYELITVMVLHRLDYCSILFSLNFCEYNIYKYFLMCIMLPTLIAVFVWWLPEFAKIFCNKSCDTQTPIQPDTIHGVLHEIISKQDIERLVATAIITGIQKFAQTHPKTKRVFGDILDALTDATPRRKKK